MALEEMQEFIRSLFRGRPDLSTLTHSIVRRRFLAHVGRDHLEIEEKQALKRLVEEELLKTQVDEASAREEKLDPAKKAKRPLTPCSDSERKRFRFNSESEPSSAVSSPDCFDPSANNGMAAAKVSAGQGSARRATKKSVESSDEEEQQRHLAAKMGLQKESSEEEEGFARTRQTWKKESSEEEEGEEKVCKGRSRKKPVASKQAPGKKTSASRKQTREESEDSEEEPVQRTGKKGKKGASSQHESEKESEEEPLAEANREEAEDDWKPRAQRHGGERSAREENCKQKSRAARLLGDWGDGEEQKEQAVADCGEKCRDVKPPEQRKRKARAQWKVKKRQSGSSEEEEEKEEDGKDNRRKEKPTKGTEKTAKEGTEKTAKEGSMDGEESDSEREVSDSEAAGSPKGERKNRSSKKSSRKDRARSCSFSSEGSLEPKDRKASTSRLGEDHPAVMRLKRYIRACGAHRNYKKLLGSCRSHKERLSVLRAELEALGMKGNPSLEKCRALKEQREEAAEVASLDVTNIIHSSGRPRRRTAWKSSSTAPPGELYHRTLDSDEEQPRQPPPDWSHMRGIISSDGESN